MEAAGFPGLRPGLRGERRLVVTPPMTTTHAGDVPVLTAPAMIMAMELTAQEVTDPLLVPEHTTVGFEIAVRHRRPTPVGATVRVTAELLEVQGRHLLFRVEAHNARERIGEGTLRRTIVRRGALA